MASLSESLWMSDQPRAYYSHLVTFSKCSGISHSAGILEEPESVFCDLIAFLAAAQWRNIDFLPITWQPALDMAGKGATAEIQQSLVSLAFTFAFKRFLTSSDADETSKRYRAIISELCILGHPAIKQHPNIVELQGVCWDAISEDQVWPVLVFPKAKYGNMHDFFASDEATRLTSDQCLCLIAGCVHAVVFMHSHGIVHGDLKPENMLVVEDEVHGFRAELCDFGFSTIHATGKLIQLPCSWPWTAPEYHRRGFTLGDAKKTDIYSLGLVSLWMLNMYTSRNQSQTVPISDSRVFDDAVSDTSPAGCQWIDSLKASGAIPQFIDDCLGGLVDFSEDKVFELRTFLLDALDSHPDTRTLRNLYLPPPSLPEVSDRLLFPASETENIQKYSDRSSFQVIHSVEQLVSSHASVRKFIARRLELCAVSPGLATLRQQAGIQLAICLAIGFGVERNIEKSSDLADSCGSSYKRVMSDLVPLQCRTSWEYHNPKIQQMAAIGLLRDMDYVYEYRKLLTPEAIEKNAERELTDMKQVFRTTHPIIYSLSTQLMHVLKSAGKLDDAQGLLNQFVMDCENDSEYPRRSLSYLSARGAQASLARHQGDYSLAKRLASPLLEEAKAILGPLHLSTCSFRNNLAIIHTSAGDYNQAGAFLREALVITSSEFGPEHPETLAVSGNLAKVLQRQGQLGDAEDAATQVYNGSTRAFGVSHPVTLASAGNLASIQQSRGKLGPAQTLLEKSLDLYERHYGASNPSTLCTLNALAVLRKNQGHLDAAEKDLTRVIQGQEMLYGRRHFETQSSVNNLAGVLMQRHDFQSAELLYREVLENTRQTLGEEHHETVTTTSNLAFAYQMQHDYVQAEALYGWAYDQTKKHVGEEHPSALKILSNISGVLYTQGKSKEAERIYRQLLQHRRRSLGSNHPDVFKIMSNLAAVLMDQGRLEESEATNRDALNAKLEQFDRDHPSVLITVNNMSTLLLMRGDYSGAEEMALWAVQGRRSTLGPNHPETHSSVMVLRQIRHARNAGVDVPSLLKM